MLHGSATNTTPRQEKTFSFRTETSQQSRQGSTALSIVGGCESRHRQSAGSLPRFAFSAIHRCSVQFLIPSFAIGGVQRFCDRPVPHQSENYKRNMGIPPYMCHPSSFLSILGHLKVDVELQEMCSNHAMGKPVTITRGGNRVRLTVAMPNGGATLVTYDTRVTSPVCGRVVYLHNDNTEVSTVGHVLLCNRVALVERNDRVHAATLLHRQPCRFTYAADHYGHRAQSCDSFGVFFHCFPCQSQSCSPKSLGSAPEKYRLHTIGPEFESPCTYVVKQAGHVDP